MNLKKQFSLASFGCPVKVCSAKQLFTSKSELWLLRHQPGTTPCLFVRALHKWVINAIPFRMEWLTQDDIPNLGSSDLVWFFFRFVPN